jgi:hypothetical protein
MSANRCPGREKFLGHHIAFEKGPFTATIHGWPGHPDPPVPANHCGKLGVMTGCKIRIRTTYDSGLLPDKSADFAT